MSTVRTNNVQVGQSVTATNNFTLYQPATPDGTVRLGVGNTGATTADVITATSAGNVGIGTSSPGARLVISGTTSSDIYRLASNQSAPTSTDAFIYRPTDNTLGFGTASTERARIDSSGNLLLNTTGTTPVQSNTAGAFSYRPAGQLEVNGNNTQAAFFGRTNDGMVVGFYSGGTRRGSVDISGATTSYVTSSDYRLKEDIQPMTGALARVAALKPVTYKWKEDGKSGQGFIAHELQAVVPDCVTGEKDAVDADGNPVYQGIDTSFLVATLTAAIQELKAELDSVKAELAALKAV